jgi:hypothetical protein
MAPNARTSFFDLVAGIIDASCNIVFLLIQLERRQHPTNLAYISSRLRGRPIALNTSESIWRYPMFASICYVSLHLEISATVVRSAPEELPNLCSFRKASAARSPMTMQGAMVLPVVTRGMIEPSAIRRFSIP